MALSKLSKNLKSLRVGGAYRALKPVKKNFWEAWTASCTKNSDCAGYSQKCTKLLWLPKNDLGKTYATGSACYDWRTNPCLDTNPFATKNINYARTDEFSYYN